MSMLLMDARVGVRVGGMPLQTASEFRAEIRSVVVGLVVGVVVWHAETGSDETACRLIETDADQQPQKELNRLKI